MLTIDQKYSFSQEIKKSLFIADLAPVNTSDEAIAFLEAKKLKHPDANHHCYSYIIGESGNNYRFSDDGEPSQTAGIVIYNVLNKNNLTNIICVVTRYFGGIKLGAGGLVRAYSSSAAGVINVAELKEIIHYKKIKITFAYPYIDSIIKLLEPYEEISKNFLENVSFSYLIPESVLDSIKTELIDITKGKIKIEVC